MIEIKHVKNENELKQCIKIRHILFVVGMNVPQSIEVDQYDCINDICDHFLIKYKNDNVGTIRCLKINDSIIKLQRFGFYKEYRHLGFGSETLRYIEDYYKKKGYYHLILDAQVKAYQFYIKNGYQKISDEFMEAGIMHIKMEKKLK